MFLPNILALVFVAGGLYLTVKMLRLTFRRYEKGLVINSRTKKRRRIILIIATLLIAAGILIFYCAPKIFGAIPASFSNPRAFLNDFHTFKA